MPHARAVRDALEPLTDDASAGAVVSAVLDTGFQAVERNHLPFRLGALGTPSELAHAVRRDVTRAGVDAAARCRVARARRRVGSWALPDGMAALQVTGPAVTIAAAVAAVDRRAQDAVDAARAARRDGRAQTVTVPTLDQARADAVLEALAGSPDLERLPGHVGLDVTVLVPLDVLTDLGAAPLATSGPPAELPGLGPLPDLVARAVAASARRVRVGMLDREGHVATPCPSNPAAGCTDAHEGAHGYRPSAALERAVRARDVTCRWPGCRARAARCDLDHTVPFPRGGTTACNLACLCRLHHRVKHRAGWLVLQGPFGRLDLVSPTRRVYLTEPVSWHRRLDAGGRASGSDDRPDHRPDDGPDDGPDMPDPSW